ncbi:MAG: hypothetical protein Fur0044_16130 [Anaerolineae bacterium]
MSIAERWQRFEKLPADVRQNLEKLVPLFEEKGVLLAYLFGSLSRHQPGNDVDIAILTRAESVFRLRAAISDILGTERVDLVDLRNAPPILRFEILCSGQLLYAVDEATQEQFELASLHLYRDTSPLRRQQEVSLRERIASWLSEKKASNSA